MPQSTTSLTPAIQSVDRLAVPDHLQPHLSRLMLIGTQAKYLIGAALYAAKADCNHGEFIPFLATLGIIRSTAHYWMQAAKRLLPDDYKDFDSFQAKCSKIEHLPLLIEGGLQDRHAVETGAIRMVHPRRLYRRGPAAMGGIDLDPASCEAANAIVQADRFFALDDDGLVQPWVGRVWLNPPYTSKAMAGFVDRFAAHDHGCILVNTVTETVYGQILLQACPVVCFHAGRISFSSPHGQKAGSGTVGQMIGYRGPTPETFADAFAPFGTILRPW